MKTFKQRQDELRNRQERVLERYDGQYAAQFRNRPRQPLWVYLLLYGAGFLVPVVAGAWILRAGIAFWLWPAMLIGVPLAAYYTWLNAAPICPKCARNIVWDRATFCHLCGEPLGHDRCERCGVNNSWAAMFDTVTNTGNRRRILYCPCCGTWLDTQCHRFGSGGDAV